MKVISIETGIEYEICSTHILKCATGKVYQKREGFCGEKGSGFSLCEYEGVDTHRGLLFIEPLKKVEPPPEIQSGDYVIEDDKQWYAYEDLTKWVGSSLKAIYRGGKVIWSRE